MSNEDFKTMNPFLDIFNVPKKLREHHSDEALAYIEEGIKKVDKLLVLAGHQHCVEYVLKYCELNIKYLFMASIVNKETMKMCLDIFIPNILNLFLKTDIKVEPV